MGPQAPDHAKDPSDTDLPASLPGMAREMLEAATAVARPVPADGGSALRLGAEEKDGAPAADAVNQADAGAGAVAGAHARGRASAGSEAVLPTPEAAIKPGKGSKKAAKQKLRTAEGGVRKKAKRQTQRRSV